MTKKSEEKFYLNLKDFCFEYEVIYGHKYDGQPNDSPLCDHLLLNKQF